MRKKAKKQEEMVYEFPVISLMREDVEQVGFKGADLDNETMRKLASRCEKYMLDGVDFWNAVEQACFYWEIPYKEEEEEEPSLFAIPVLEKWSEEDAEFMDDETWEDSEDKLIELDGFYYDEWDEVPVDPYNYEDWD